MANKRLIDANAVESKILDCINAFHENMIESGPFENWKGCTLDGLQKASQIIFTTPTVDAVEVVHGRWQERRFICMDSEVMLGYRCSNCNLTYDVETNFCPNCGAKMDGGNEDG